MQSRYYTPEDYENVANWWKQWDWEPLPQIALPEIGIVVSNQGVDLGVAFLYQTDSCICWAENYVVNKEVDKKLRAGCVEFLIEKIIEEAKELGFLMVMSSVTHTFLIKKLLRAGYQVTDKEMTNLLRVL